MFLNGEKLGIEPNHSEWKRSCHKPRGKRNAACTDRFGVVLKVGVSGAQKWGTYSLQARKSNLHQFAAN